MNEEPRDLIVQAFLRARTSGKSPTRMSVAVLKNRLLQMTGHAFKEQNYGALTFRAFLEKFPDLVRIDAAEIPLAVELLHQLPGNEPTVAGVTSGRAHEPESGRIRPDLWNAVMDFGGGHVYGWDSHKQCARVLTENESLPRLPTITAEDLNQWRREFLTAQEPSLSPIEIARVKTWVERRLPTNMLPVRIRRPWNMEMKRRTIERIHDWFRSNGITLPTNLIEPATRVDYASETDDLRAFLVECIRAMTVTELQEMKLPARIVVKVLKARR